MEFIKEYTDNNIKQIVDDCYQFYLTEIKTLDIYLDETLIKWKRYPIIDKKEGTFFHLITKDYKNKDGYCCPNLIIECDKDFTYNPMMKNHFKDKRTICGHRIQCLYLMIDFLTDEDLIIWDRVESTPKGLRTRIKVLNEKAKYFYVFDKRNNGDIYYWTSYPVDIQKINKFKKEYYNNNQNIHKLTIKQQGTQH